MKRLSTANQRGIGSVGTILIIIALVVGAGLGLFFFNKKDDKSTDTAAQKAVKNATCNYNDKDLCKFFAAWKTQPQFTANVASEQDGKKTNSVLKVANKQDYSVTVGGDTPYEVIYIGNTSYIKNAKDNTWYKQTNPSDNESKGQADFDFAEPASANSKITYKKVGKEKCGDVDCYKYQIIDSSDTSGITNYIWFDNDDFLLRRMQTTSKDVKNNSTLVYGAVAIKAPSPVKELQANQHFVPGQSEPVTLPATGDAGTVEDMISQYQ